MKVAFLTLASAALLAACAPAPPAAIPVARPMDSTAAQFDPVATQADLETTARQRFGESAVQQALAADSYLFAKHYFGLAPPPVVQPDGSYKYPDPPMALLMREDGVWRFATRTGWRQPAPDQVTKIEALLNDPAFWAEPAWAIPSCTDAGGSLLMLKVPRRDRIIRRGACGATAKTEQLIFLALNA